MDPISCPPRVRDIEEKLSVSIVINVGQMKLTKAIYRVEQYKKKHVIQIAVAFNMDVKDAECAFQSLKVEELLKNIAGNDYPLEDIMIIMNKIKKVMNFKLFCLNYSSYVV
jgi:hypothetical protein